MFFYSHGLRYLVASEASSLKVYLINMCLGVFRLGFILFGTLCVSWTWVIISFPERKTPIQYTNTYIWNLERWQWRPCMQDSKKDTDVYNGLMDSEGEGEGGMIWENGILTCILSCKNWIASLCLTQNTACLGLVHGDDQRYEFPLFLKCSRNLL